MNIPHPSTYLQADFTETIRKDAAAAETLGHLTEKQLQLIYEQRWFKMFVPKTYGGLNLSFPDSIRLEEALSWADGSMGWTVTLCSGAGWFAGFLEPEYAQKLFSSAHTCLGGSGAPSGTAIISEEGYMVTGKWKYATGAPHLTQFTANCKIENLNEDETPSILSFIFDRQDVTLIDDWQTSGLIATASRSFEVNQLYVPVYRTFKLDSDHAFLNNSIYRYPFLQFAEATLSINTCGMALHFVDLCEEIYAARISNKNLKDYQQKVLNDVLENAKKLIDEKRSAFYSAVEHSWLCVTKDEPVSAGLLNEVSTTSRDLASAAIRQVNELYPYCGMTAADPMSEINRVWRDLHTASQHTLLALPW